MRYSHRAKGRTENAVLLLVILFLAAVCSMFTNFERGGGKNSNTGVKNKHAHGIRI